MNNKTKDKLSIVVTGGSGRFGSVLQKVKTKHKTYFPTRKELNILSLKSINKYILKKKPKIIIHLAALSRPMELHDKNISESIKLNIIGTSNITIACNKYNVKLIYMSTNFVYPGTKGNYKETDNLKPFNNYGWSKLGGECAVSLYKNSLILRMCTTEKPFLHKKAFTDVKTNFDFHENIAKKIYKLINKKGIINIGGRSQSVFNFVKQNGLNVKKIKARKLFGKEYPLKQDMNLNRLKKILKN